MSKENQEVLENENKVNYREFQIKVGSATNKTTGEKFPTFKTVRKDGKFMRVKFRKVVESVPSQDCIIVVAEDKVSIDTNRQYPVLWVHEIADTKALFQPNYVEEKTQEKLGEYFD